LSQSRRPAQEEGISLSSLAEKLQVDKATVSRRWRVARARGYLRNLETVKGRPARIVLADALPEELEILPSPEELRNRCTVDGDFGGQGTPLPLPPGHRSARLDHEGSRPRR
jgi:hypothetical protein